MLPRMAIAYLWMRQLAKANIGRPLSALTIDDYRTSDTVFIFGTGASINTYPDEWWRIIRNHDSIGMNFFLLHEHVPTFHVMEGVNGERRLLLSDRYIERGDYRNVPLILKTQLSNLSSSRIETRINELTALPAAIRSRLYLSVDLLAAGKTPAGVEASYRLFSSFGLWTPKPRILTVTKRRGSVAYVINLAVRAGYRRLVLCGVDLNHSEYFYDSRRPELEATGLPVPDNRESGHVHGTNDPDKDPVTIHHVIMAIKRAVLDPAGIELLVAKDTSALYPDLSLFDWSRGNTVSDKAEFQPRRSLRSDPADNTFDR